MDKVRKELAKEYGAENILTLIGTRFDESNTRGNRMRARGERAPLAPPNKPILAAGSYLRSLIGLKAMCGPS